MAPQKVHFGIHDEWNYAAWNAMGPGACSPDMVGGRWDPTLACSPER
jgi:hypothetical protein